MVERLLKDEGWSLKAEVCPVVPPHFLLSAFPQSRVLFRFQLSAFSDLCFLLSTFCFSLGRFLLSAFQ
jgi:hypothetical protein